MGRGINSSFLSLPDVGTAYSLLSMSLTLLVADKGMESALCNSYNQDPFLQTVCLYQRGCGSAFPPMSPGRSHQYSGADMGVLVLGPNRAVGESPSIDCAAGALK